MAKRLNLVGQRFGRLIVIGRAPSRNAGMQKCVCDCGSTVTVSTGGLRSGGIVSCGCRRREHWDSFSRKHGQTHTPTHRSWLAMISRCTTRGTPGWKRYGGRGIRVCKRWTGKRGFENFLADMGPRPAGLTLDRKRVNGNYTPTNCRWATKFQQANNTSRNRTLTWNGRTMTIAEWSLETGIDRCTIVARLSIWKNVQRALTEPVDHRKGKKAA